MCDWTTHLAVGWLATRIGNVPKTSFLIGCVIPDLVWIWSYPLSLFLNPSTIDALLRPSHTLLGAFLLSATASIAFRGNLTRIISFLYLGSLLHLSLDLLMTAPPGYGLFLFFPLSWRGYALNVASMTNPMPMIISSSLCVVVFLIDRLMWSKRKSS